MVLIDEKLWKVAFKEDEDREDLVPGQGWCGYLAIDQVRRQADAVTKMDQAGIQHLIDTVDAMIRCGNGGIRPGWRSRASLDLTTREVLLSVKDTLTNWERRLKDSLEKARWLNSQNIYGTCGTWNYSLWGEDPDDSGYCELRDSHLTQGSATNLEEWRWALSRNMVVGARGHYYVRRGGLLDEFEIAFKEAMELAVIKLRSNLTPTAAGEVTIDESNELIGGDVIVGYSAKFHEAMGSRGKRVLTVDGDGYCQFHAVAGWARQTRRGNGGLW
jgi:hypothetical protein